MSLSRRTPLQQIVLVVFAAGLAPCAASGQQPSVTPSPARGTGIVQPTARPDNTTADWSAIQQPSVQLYNSLLGETGAGSLTEPVLVVPGKPMDPQAIGQAVEDLSVMSRIIEKNTISEYNASGGFGEVTVYNPYRMSAWNGAGPVTLFPAIGRAKPMYLGGYGAVFFIQVNYPLLPPPQTPQEPPANQPPDPVWAEAKRSVLEPPAQPVLPQEGGEAAEPYSRESVDTLRGGLIAAMRHATNIRVLEPTEWVTIVVQGVAPAPQAPEGFSAAPAALPVTATPGGRTVLTLRATKADVDQYAKGQLDQQQFAQRVQIVTY